MERLTMLVTPDGKWVFPNSEEFLALLGDQTPDYDAISFAFPPAFMREARLRVAAEWQPTDLAAVTALVASGRLSLDGLITHRTPFTDAAAAYATAFRAAAYSRSARRTSAIRSGATPPAIVRSISSSCC